MNNTITGQIIARILAMPEQNVLDMLDNCYEKDVIEPEPVHYSSLAKTAIAIVEKIREDIVINKFDDTFYMEYFLKIEIKSYTLKIKAVYLEHKINLKNTATNQVMADTISDAIKKMHDSRQWKYSKIIYYAFSPGNEYSLQIQIQKIKSGNVFVLDDDSSIGHDQVIINVIDDAGPNGISATDLNKKTKSFVTKAEREEILKDLIQDKIIILSFDVSHGRKKKIYTANHA